VQNPHISLNTLNLDWQFTMDFHRLFDILPYQMAKYPQQVALAGRRQGGDWQKFSTAECLRYIERLSAGMLRAGFQRGDTAALLAHCGSPTWNFIDQALQQIGVVVVPVHATALAKDVAFILEDAGVKYCFASNGEMLAKFNEANAGKVEVFTFDKITGTRHWEELLVDPTPGELNALAALKNSIAETDLATILYTSGTTGSPKGVRLSHRNIVSNIKAVLALVPVSHRQDALSFLPLSHIFERMVTHLYMAAGTSVWYACGMQNLDADLREVRPHFLTVVPRILEKMFDLALERRQSLGWLGRKIFDAAIGWGENCDPFEKFSPVFWLRHQLFDLAVYRHWRRALGGRVSGVFVGAAALQPRLARLFCAAGIRVREGYGLTETSPVVAFNHFEPGLFRFGTVGLPVPGVEVKIDGENEEGEGEILVKGPNVMMGYHRQPEETAAVLNSEGWLRTGDVGGFVERRFLKITDRKRDIFKTSVGKFVAPQRVESHFAASPFINQCMVLGYNRPYVSALIVPDFTALQRWCEENGVHWTAPQFMVLNPRVIKQMDAVVEALNQQFEPHEQVRKFTLLHEEWTTAGGELTFTLKLSRKGLLGKFSREIEAMY
jgi:long-chain acyl-CoA synthetase